MFSAYSQLEREMTKAATLTPPRRLVALTVLTLVLGACGPTGEPDAAAVVESVAVSAADYARAEGFLAPNTGPLVRNNIQAQHWQSDDSLVYQRSTGPGFELVLADFGLQSSTTLLDSAALSRALSDFEGEAVAEDSLRLSDVDLLPGQQVLEFSNAGDRYRLQLEDMVISLLDRGMADEYLSPDGTKAAFIQGHNLWLRDTLSDELTQLTFDGYENYGYATNNAGWLRSDGPVLKWSPDSRSIATFRHDAREVGEMYLYDTRVGHVELDAWKYPLPGDEHIFMIERLVIHLDPAPSMVRLDMPPDPHRSTTSDHVAGRGGEFLDVAWSDDSQLLAFVSSSRDHKVAQLRVADPRSGAVRDVHSESVATYFESGFDGANWRVLPQREEFLWFSERDNWGHLYLHDLSNGELKRQLTAGSWAVLSVERVDLADDQVYFRGANREPGDPYYHYLYRVDLAGGEPVLLTPEPAHHQISWSPSGEYFTDVYSTPTQPGRAVVRDQAGEVVMALEQTDISALEAAGWVAPIPFTVKARDQQTDLFGLMYRPSNFAADRRYPILNYLYPGPQAGSVGSRAFQAVRRDKQAVAELGFVVVEVDAMGTPGRSKSFHDAYYGNMGDNGLPDQIAAIRQLAADNPWMDLERVGIWGHSGGGFASTAGILRYPDFYKVAVSSAGNHDNRNYEDDWGEKWQGLLETYPESTVSSAGRQQGTPRTNYDDQANQLLVENLEGKLLLAHGMLDTNVHPSSTLLVVEALIEAEKDFDLLVLPNAGHGFGNSRYFMQRRWDYFVEHLLGVSPPSFTFADNIP